MTEKNEKDNTKEIAAAVAERCKAEAAELEAEAEDQDEITPEFIQDCLHANEQGDGFLYVALHRDRYIYNKTSLEWFLWADHYWVRDKKGHAHRAVDEVAKVYLKEANQAYLKRKELDDDKKDEKKRLDKIQENFSKRANRLRSVRGGEKCLRMSHIVDDDMSITSEEFDDKSWLLTCQNGVVDLRTGRHRAGDPKDYLTKAVPHDWLGIDSEAPLWEKALNDIFDNDKELIAYIQRLFGYAITGAASDHVFIVLFGDGRNGKGLLVETLKYVLSDLAQPIQSEMLLEQRVARNAAAPSPDIMGLKGLKLAFASETDENRKFSTEKVKWLTGGDTLTGRNPNDKYDTRFAPTHLLCLLTNHLPHAPADDIAFWDRMQVVPFNIRFVDKPLADNERVKDKDLGVKLKAEASGILPWLVRGCLEWQRIGLQPPLSVTSATEKYRSNEDTIGSFVDACCENPDETDKDKREQVKPMYNAYNKWHLENVGAKPIGQKRFNKVMEKKFTKELKGGKTYFYGVELLPDWLRV